MPSQTPAKFQSDTMCDALGDAVPASEGRAVHHAPRFRMRLAHVVVFVALAVVPVLAVDTIAVAGSDGSKPGLDATQQQCLTDHGVSVSAASAHGKAGLTKAQRVELKHAEQVCGLRPGHARPMGTRTRGHRAS